MRNPFAGKPEILLSTPLPGCQSGEWIGGVGFIENSEVRWFDHVERRLELTGITKDQILEDLRVLAASQRGRSPIPFSSSLLPLS